VAVLPKNVANIFPLTPLQEGMLFHALLDTSADAYFQQVVWEVRGSIDIDAFEAAWSQIVSRYDALRTVFGHLGTDRPLQVVLREQPVRVDVVDFSGIATAEQPASVERFIAEDRAKPFDLARGPLMRLFLLRRGDAAWTAIWSHHHIVLDGWSIAIVLADWVKTYTALRKRQQPVLGPTAPWSHYIRWLESRAAAPSEIYWRDYIAGFETATPLPMLSGEGAGTKDGRIDFSFDLGSETSRRLGRWAARHNATANAAVHAMWAILLGRYCGTSDVLFGTVVSGRPPEVAGIEQMVGNFVNTIPVRLRPQDDLTIAEFLATARNDLIASTPHQFFPLSRIQAQSPLRAQLLGSLIAYENYPVDQSRLDEGEQSLGFTIEGARTVELTHYPLAVQFLPGESLHVRIVGRGDEHTERQLRRLEGHFRRIVDVALEDDARRIGDIDLLSDAECAELAESLNPPFDENVPPSVLPLIAWQAEQHPDAIAVEGRSLSLSYRALDRESASLGARLRTEHRIGRDDVVPLLAGRDAHAILGMVSVLRAGAAYLPLDPEQSRGRLTQFLAQSQARVVLADPASAELARAIATVPVVEIEPGRAMNDAAVTALPPADPRALAYVIYTSGSTGEAKAVAIEHRSLGNLVAALSDAVYRDLPASMRIAVVASFGFDASIKQIYAALCGGHTLVVADADTRRDPVALSNWFVNSKIAVADATPTMLSAIVGTGNAARLRQNLRHLLIGGEALPATLVSALLDGPRSLEITNVYGPTECCVDTTAHRCSVGAVDTTSIGRPLKNQRVYLLDAKLRPVPFGAPGEICVGGLGVARGYLGRADLTAEKFRPDPFVPGGTLYRTGDRGRWRANGELEFLGRSDDQIKIRGHRIEIGEIETHLNAHPGIAAAAVLTREEEHGLGLIACIVPRAPLTVHTLRRDLAASMPDYMLPAAWFTLPSLPMTTGGKVDRVQLMRGLGDYAPLPMGIAHVPPRNALERRLVLLWGELIGNVDIGIEDNYFSLGGDSIKAITLVSRLHREGWALALKDLFAHPTIAELAPYLRRIEPTRRVGTRPASVPLTPMQTRRLVGLAAPPARFNQTILLRATEALDAAAVRAALSAVVRHHEALRLAVRQEAGTWRQAAMENPPVSLDVVDLRASANPAEELAAHAEKVQGSHDPTNGRVLAAAIYRRVDGDRLLISVHHFAIDAVSWRVLLEDLMVAYRAARDGVRLALPPTTGYLDWAAGLEAEAARVRTKEFAHWDGILRANVAPLTFDGASAANREGDAAEVSRRLDSAASAAIVSTANELYRTTPEELLVVALARAFARWNGNSRLRIALEGNGRSGSLGLDIARTIGWFTALYPVIVDLPTGRDPGYQVRAIKEQLRAVPGDGVGFGLLRWIAGAGAALPAEPEIPVLFNYLGRVGEAVESNGFAWDDTPIGSDVDAALLRHHELNLSAALIGNELRLGLRYGGRRLAGDKANRLIDLWAEEAAVIADHLVRGVAVPQLTPSDLTYAGISLDELESIVS
jgi:amino acid adenylation domain-containing protein/non-ribosomal peptide synthase protein (TIGR01720 family)